MKLKQFDFSNPTFVFSSNAILALGHIAVTLSSDGGTTSGVCSSGQDNQQLDQNEEMKKHENAILKFLLQWFDQNSVDHSNLLIDQVLGSQDIF